MNIYQVRFIDIESASAPQVAELLQVLGNLMIIEADIEWQIQPATGTATTYHTNVTVKTPYQYNLPPSNVNILYNTICIDTNCTQILTNLQKTQLTQGDLVVVLSAIPFGDQLSLFATFPLTPSVNGWGIIVGMATDTQSPTYTPFVGSQGFAIFARAAVQGTRGFIEASKAVAMSDAERFAAHARAKMTRPGGNQINSD